MRTLYGIQFDLQSPDGEGAQGTVDALIDEFGDWLAGKYPEAEKAALIEDGTSHPQAGHQVSVERKSGSDALLVDATLEHPDGDSASVRWRTSLRIARLDDQVEVTARLQIYDPEFRVKPFRYGFGRPRIVTNILSRFECYAGNVEQIPSTRTRIVSDGVAEFVEFLEKEERRLPVVVVSVDPETNAPAVSSQTLQESLLGYARVVELADVDTSYALTSYVDKARSCFDGAVRTYWPGFSRADDPMEHELTLEKDIHRPNARKPFHERLFEKFANIASDRSTDGPITREVRSRIEEARTREMNELRQRVESAAASEDYKEMERELDQVMDEWQAALKEREELEQRLREMELEQEHKVEQLEAENEGLKENLRLLNQPAYSGDSEDTGGDDLPPTSDFDTVHQALSAADRHFDVLNVWDDAWDGAGGCDFENPDRCFNALEAIAAVAQRKIENDGELGEHPKKIFKVEHGFKLAIKESEQTMNLHGEDRHFRRPDGGAEEVQQHLTIGGGSRRNCVQVYFELDHQRERAEIAYCGRHLPYAGRST